MDFAAEKHASDGAGRNLRAQLRRDIRALGRKPTTAQQNTIGGRRRRLQSRIDKYHKDGANYLTIPEDEMMPDDDELEDLGHDANLASEEPAYDEEEVPQPALSRRWAESVLVLMPSTLRKQRCTDWNLRDLRKEEIQLREGQANEALHNLRTALGHKSLLFRSRIRNSHSQRTTTRAWAEVNKVEAKVRAHVASYRRARRALVVLGASAATLKKLRDIRPEELKMPGDLVEENRFNQRSDSMAWFWRLDANKDMTNNSWMEECEHANISEYLRLACSSQCASHTVYRVAWLRAKARRDRWQEELTLLPDEMLWTVLTFLHHSQQWTSREGQAQQQALRGHQAYAARQAAMWKKFAEDAGKRFRELRESIAM